LNHTHGGICPWGKSVVGHHEHSSHAVLKLELTRWYVDEKNESVVLIQILTDCKQLVIKRRLMKSTVRQTSSSKGLQNDIVFLFFFTTAYYANRLGNVVE
jgi:hypothetical protein